MKGTERTEEGTEPITFEERRVDLLQRGRREGERRSNDRRDAIERSPEEEALHPGRRAAPARRISAFAK